MDKPSRSLTGWAYCWIEDQDSSGPVAFWSDPRIARTMIAEAAPLSAIIHRQRAAAGRTLAFIQKTLDAAPQESKHYLLPFLYFYMIEELLCQQTGYFSHRTGAGHEDHSRLFIGERGADSLCTARDSSKDLSWDASSRNSLG